MNTPRITSAADQGPRANYEDASAAFHYVFYALAHFVFSILVACDGVGGGPAGEIASRTGVQRIVATLVTLLLASRRCPDDLLDAVGQALRQANAAVCEQARTSDELRGMASTAVCAMIADDHLLVGSAGDSRCYLHNQHKGLIRVTTDHTKVQDLINAGQLDPKDAWLHPLAHRINRYLGQSTGFVPDTRHCHLSPGDIVLLCSDGLTDVLSDEDIAAVIEDCKHGLIPFNDLARVLVRKALDGGTSDNTTVLCYQHGPSHEGPVLSHTLTGAYPVVVGRTLGQRLLKEPVYV